MENTGLFVGSFDPFTTGHDSIVRRALPLFSRLVIGVGHNPEKHYEFSLDERISAISSLYSDESRIEVVAYSDFAVDLAHRIGAHFIVKGVRNTQDFEYERIQADFNRRLGGVETLLLFTEPQLESISSTAVRQLRQFGKDYSWMIPQKQTSK